MGFYNTSPEQDSDVQIVTDLVNEAKQIKVDVEATQTEVDVTAQYVKDDRTYVEGVRNDLTTLSADFSNKLQELETALQVAGDLQVTLNNNISQVSQHSQDVLNSRNEIQQMKESVEQSAVVIAQYVVDVDNDRIDAEKARDEASRIAKEIDSQMLIINQQIADAETAINAANTALADIDQIKQDCLMIKSETEEFKAEAVDAKDEAITRADEAMTYSISSKSSSDLSKGYRDTTKNYLDQTLASAATVQQAVTEVKADADRADSAASTATNKAAIASSEATRAQDIADSLQGIADGQYGVVNINGKTGVVTLSATDVGAIPDTGGSITGDITFGASHGVTFGNWHMEGTSSGELIFRTPDKLAGFFDSNHSLKVAGDIFSKGQKVYSPLNKPTANELGVLPDTYLPAWADITGAPSVFPSNWAQVSNKPNTATRWPSWDEVTGKPSLFSGNYADLSGKPTSFPPSAHQHTWSNITNTPVYATRWATWDDVTGKPDFDSLYVKPNTDVIFGMLKVDEIRSDSFKDSRGATVFEPQATPDLMQFGVPFRKLRLRAKDTPQLINEQNQITKLYHEGFKPTAAEIGAEPLLNNDRKRLITDGTAAPSGGNDGDIYLQYE